MIKITCSWLHKEVTCPVCGKKRCNGDMLIWKALEEVNLHTREG